MSSSTYASPKILEPEKEVKTLRIRTCAHLALQLGISSVHLEPLIDNTTKYYREFDRNDKNGKPRHFIEATGSLKLVQRRILDRILTKLPPSKYAFGAIRGKSIKDNACVHVNSKYIAKLDISNFYPSIHSSRVYRFFVNQKKCSPDVAHALAALTTRNYSLPLGTSTSPFLADQIVNEIDTRIGGMVRNLGLKYTRYVDDITLSGDYDFLRVFSLVKKILKQNGFTVKKEKTIYYTPQTSQTEKIITGVRIVAGRVSAPLDYISALQEELREAIVKSKSRHPQGDFGTRQHYRGQIGYIMWLDRPVGERLLKLYRKVKWRRLEWI